MKMNLIIGIILGNIQLFHHGLIPPIPYSESVCNPSGPSNLGDVYNFFGPDSIDYPDYTPIPKATYYAAWILFKNDIISFFK